MARPKSELSIETEELGSTSSVESVNSYCKTEYEEEEEEAEKEPRRSHGGHGYGKQSRREC
ncbi:hypothetical protein CCACVL1_20733 [Corchorus capsularis]|uniref:Uncharacterized protein n=1 Tax=Corchorus capsularis TaxID=210143 RepID=A0A1R3H9Y3_COCAP|nr:hypothetical protein CCACVL1_20733 [Corchorus capsularis]